MAEAKKHQEEFVASIDEQKVQREATRPSHDARVTAMQAAIDVAFSGAKTGTGN